MDKLEKVAREIFKSYGHQIGQNFSEILEFLRITKSRRVSNFLEIGTQYGSTFNLLLEFTDGLGISLDKTEGTHGGLTYPIVNERNEGISKCYPRREIHFLDADSHLEETKDRVTGLLRGRKLDLLFIDGDHSYEGVKSDYLMYKSLVKVGGLIVFHDINLMEDLPDCEVYKFWNELESPNKFEINHRTSWTKTSPILGGIGFLVVS